MSVPLDIANLERLYAVGEMTPDQTVREVHARIRKKRVRPDWITLIDGDRMTAATTLSIFES